MRRIELGWVLSVIGNMAGTVALVVYTYDEGGPRLVAAYGVARTVAGVIVGLGVASVSDRLRRDRVLRVVCGLNAILLGLAALVAWQSGPPSVVIILAAASAALAGTYRPLQAAILPWVVRTPADLTASNAASAMMENTGALIGPVLAGVLVGFVSAPAAVAAAAGSLALSAAAVIPLTVSVRPTSTSGGHRHVLRELAEGFASFTRLVPPSGIAVLLGAQTLVRGALTVLIAILAVDELDLGQAAVGWLTAALGLGGLVGGIVAAATVRATRLGRGFVVGLILWGVPLGVLAIAPTPAVAYAALFVAGIGNAIEDVGVFTLLARLAKPRMMGRVLAGAELMALAGVGIGSLVAPPLVDMLGTSGALGLLGGGLAVLALGYARRFAKVDRTMPIPGPKLDLLRNLPMFAPLSLAVIELLATELRPHRFPAGSIVIREGDPGDAFHIITQGSAAVSVRGVSRPSLGRGDCFGEIALLRNVPRTATVTALEELHTLSLDRVEFLAAVNGNTLSGEAAAAVAEDRLAGDPPDHADAGKPT